MRIVGCFLFHEGKFVVLLRHSHKPSGNTWGLPAGKVEKDEEDKVAVLRELCEETGYAGKERELQHLGDFQFGDSSERYTFVAYKIDLSNSYDVTLETSAHSQYKWVTPAECYKLPNVIPDLHKLLRLIQF